MVDALLGTIDPGRLSMRRIGLFSRVEPRLTYPERPLLGEVMTSAFLGIYFF
jgi:hypothetical protein